MIVGKSLAAAALAVMLCPPVVAGQDPAPVIVPASSRWVVDLGEDRCRAARHFGPSDKPSILFIDQLAPREAPNWTIAGPVTRSKAGTRRQTVRFGASREPISQKDQDERTLEGYGKALSGVGFDPPLHVQPKNLSQAADADYERQAEELRATSRGQPHPISVESGRNIEWIEIADGRTAPVRLATGEMSKVFATMTECMDNFIRSWGLDPAVERGLTRQASVKGLNELARRIRMMYPTTAERLGEQADLVIRVMVDAAGKPTSCTTVKQTVATNFADQACEIVVKHGEFEPALVANGQAVPSVWSSTLFYRLYTP